ncbi:MAG: LacI family DNA-binding transcriptional regulator [Anaerolineae bacterium]|nr:LacI family DNA-binding transcriptional regulator [Anaerolineae bacterium]
MSQPRHPRRTITSQDVANLAGVSRATVSAVVNKSRYVSDDLIQRVEDAIRTLGYKPNILARGLKTQRTNTIGLIIPNVLSPVWALITRSVELRARALGYSTIVCDSDEDLDTERDCVRLLATQQVDGIIIAPCSLATEEYLVDYMDERPFLFIDRQPYTLEIDCVTTDKAGGTYLAIKHLLDQGCQRPAIVTNMIVGQEQYLDSEWIGGYKKALQNAGLPLDERLIRVGRRGRYSESDGYENTLQLLQLPDPPDAIVACTHFTTMGVLRAARARNVDIPQDVALVGFEDVIYNEYVHPSLSVVSQPWDQVGHLAVDLLTVRIRTTPDGGLQAEPQRHILPGDLIIRVSSVPVRQQSF